MTTISFPNDVYHSLKKSVEIILCLEKINMSNQNKKNDRRNFLRSMITAGTAIGLVTPIRKKPTSQNSNKIKMLTAEGKLVEVDKSVLEKNASVKKASDKEVFEWMDKKHKT
jgi:hypothetical protein